MWIWWVCGYGVEVDLLRKGIGCGCGLDAWADRIGTRISGAGGPILRVDLMGMLVG